MVEDVLEEVRQERIKQDDKWGAVPRDIDPFHWLAILAEEFGEFAMDVNDRKFEEGKWLESNMRNELIQIAAVAVVIVEDLDIQAETKEDW